MRLQYSIEFSFVMVIADSLLELVHWYTLNNKPLFLREWQKLFSEWCQYSDNPVKYVRQ